MLFMRLRPFGTGGRVVSRSVASRTINLLGSLVDVPSLDHRRRGTTSCLRGCVRTRNVAANHGKGGV